MFQFSDPSYHSYRSPVIRIIRNEIDLIVRKSEFILFIRIGIGMRRTISMSNTMKITARRKNRIENGIRADRVGSNPHSNGDSFSRLLNVDRVAVIHAIITSSGGIKIATLDEIKIRFIYQKLL